MASGDPNALGLLNQKLAGKKDPNAMDLLNQKLASNATGVLGRLRDKSAQGTAALQAAPTPQLTLDVDQQIQLFDILGKELPISRRKKKPAMQQTGSFAMRQRAEGEAAYNALIASGLSHNQVDTVLKIRKQISPGLFGKMKQTAGEDVGGLAGGIGGAKLALSIGQMGPLMALHEEVVTVPLLAMLGAAFGGGVGATAQKAISPYESPSARVFLRAAARQGMYEGIGRGASALGGRIFAKRPRPEVRQMELGDVGRIFKEQGGFFTPKQRDARLGIGTAEELSRGSFGGGRIFSGFDKEQASQVLETSKVIANSIADDTLKEGNTLGRELFETFVRSGEHGIKRRGARQELLGQFFDPMYTHAGKLSPNATMSSKPIKDYMRKELAKDARIGGGEYLSATLRSRYKKALGLKAKVAKGDTRVFHGATTDIAGELRPDDRGIVWATKDKTWARGYGTNVLEYDIPTNKILNMDSPEGLKIIKKLGRREKLAELVAAEKKGYLAIERGKEIATRSKALQQS